MHSMENRRKLSFVTLRVTGGQKQCGSSVTEAAPLLAVRVDAIVRHILLGVNINGGLLRYRNTFT